MRVSDPCVGHSVIEFVLQVRKRPRCIQIFLGVVFADLLDIVYLLFQSQVVDFLVQLVFPHPFLKPAKVVCIIFVDNLFRFGVLTQSELLLLRRIKLPSTDGTLYGQIFIESFVIRGL